MFEEVVIVDILFFKIGEFLKVGFEVELLGDLLRKKCWEFILSFVRRLIEFFLLEEVCFLYLVFIVLLFFIVVLYLVLL